VVRGRVQGVCFRAFVQQTAIQLALKGFVRNLPSGNEVEVQAEGDKNSLEQLISYLKVGPEGAAVSELTIHWLKYCGQFSLFEIRY
jgi:acylphosphatase